MNRQELSNLRDLHDLVLDTVTEISRLLESYNQHLFELWKEQGKLISDEIPGLNLTEVLERLEETVEEVEFVQEEEDDDSYDDLLGRFLKR